MAKEKNSFVMYYEWGAIIRKLQTEKGYQLILAIFDYVENGIEPDFSNDLLLQVAWIPIFNQLNRDADSYRNKCEQNAKNGKKGGEAKGEAYARRKEEQIANAISGNTKIANAKKENSEKAKIADNDDVDVDVDDSDDGNVVVCDNEPSGTRQDTTQIPSLEDVKNELLAIGFTEEQSEKASREFYQYNESHDWKFLPYAKWQDKLDGWIGRDVALKDEYKKLKNKKTKEQAEAEEEECRQREFDEKYWDNDINRYDLNYSPEDFADYIYGDRHYYGDDELCRRMHDFFIPEELEQMYKDGAVEMGDPDRYVIGLYERGKCKELIIHFMKRHVRSRGIVPFVWKSREDELEERNQKNTQVMYEEPEYAELPFS